MWSRLAHIHLTDLVVFWRMHISPKTVELILMKMKRTRTTLRLVPSSMGWGARVWSLFGPSTLERPRCRYVPLLHRLRSKHATSF